ncbi:unnamed protein product [Phytophthora fragariaefolia]|uniref:Unnamed protein product n=1 Tax=Phytophthora fragariaefolia TaxID=1490495 RepID=A0A9W6Y7L3_9STRA|nr:unnamed protein product [Phytophthora fragariaefolia]
MSGHAWRQRTLGAHLPAMAEDQLLHNVSGFMAGQDVAVGLKLEDLDSQQLLADTDVLLQSLFQNPTKIPIAQNLAHDTNKSKRGFCQDEGRPAPRCKVTIRKPVESVPGDPLALVAWRAVAFRQYESRMEAEALQKRLRDAVESRAAMIVDLESVLRKRVLEVEKFSNAPEFLEKKARLGAKNATLYNTYFENLDALYKRVGEVFRDVGVSPTPGGILSGEPTRKLDGDTEYFETIGVGRVPFSFQRTCDAVWELSSVPHREEGRKVYDGLPDPVNSLAIQYCSPLRRENGQEFNLRTYQVVRRYFEPTRMVVVWRALCEADGEFPGLNSDETGWAIVHAPTNDADFFADPASTLVQACIRLVPMHFQDGGVEKEAKVDQFMELLVKTGVEDNQEIGRMMERLLLDDALAMDGMEIS